MESLFNTYGRAYTKESIDKFQDFSAFLREYNQKVNLTAITDEEGVKEKHFLDSARGVKFFPENARVAEIGSGGGFPSVPLCFLREDIHVTQIESVGKKCNFLSEVKTRYGLNTEVVCARAEDVGKNPKTRESFDAVTARAVANLSTLLEYCLPLVKVGGVFVCYKGSFSQTEEELSAAQNALKVLGGKVEEKRTFTLPSGDERMMLIIKKVASTPQKYPRGNGKERSKPL